MGTETMAKGRGLAAIALAVALAALMLLTACSSGGAVAISKEKIDAKTVIKAASNVLAASEDLGVSMEESPVTISQDDPRFSQFYEELFAYKGMSDIEVSDCTFTVSVKSVTAATAREDSQQTNYRYTVNKADMNVDGKHITYDKKKGFGN